jgi:endonuclease/exonuclease/phosphatase family metal-dependent hydrolase
VARLLGHELFRRSSHLPTLIAGDFNDWRNTLSRSVFAPQGFHEATAPPSRFRSFPAYLPVASLDKAFHRGAVTVRHVRLVHSRLAREASDHLPLVVDFHLNGHGPR